MHIWATDLYLTSLHAHGDAVSLYTRFLMEPLVVIDIIQVVPSCCRYSVSSVNAKFHALTRGNPRVDAAWGNMINRGRAAFKN